MDWLTNARDIFINDIYASETTGIIIDEAKPGYAVCSLKINRQHCNAQGNVMGGAIFTLADYAFAIASNLGRPPTVSQSSNITFLSSPAGNMITATAHIIRAGKRSCFCTVEVSDNTGKSVAYVTVTGMTIELKK